jgi:hypothetical protein
LVLGTGSAGIHPARAHFDFDWSISARKQLKVKS